MNGEINRQIDKFKDYIQIDFANWQINRQIYESRDIQIDK